MIRQNLTVDEITQITSFYEENSPYDLDYDYMKLVDLKEKNSKARRAIAQCAANKNEINIPFFQKI